MDVEYNTQFYTFEKITYPFGILDRCVDATYIIHLDDNGRWNNIQKQLAKYHPSQTLYILHNPGFKDGKKKLKQNISYHDLNDAYLQCFSHANKAGYNNILILEDDFIFSSEIKNSRVVQDIADFLSKQQGKEFIYHLGCIPMFIYPCDWQWCHFRSYKSFTTHATIYSQAARNKKFNLSYNHWDRILGYNIPYRYLYCKPLCFQNFIETENRSNWINKKHIFYFFYKLYAELVIFILQIDEFAEFGFHFVYLNAKYLPLLSLISFIFISIILYFYYSPIYSFLIYTYNKLPYYIEKIYNFLLTL
jgi:hypothetical protein